MAKAKQVSEFDKNMSKAEGENFVEGEAPGSTVRSSLYFDGLGYLEDFEDRPMPGDAEGTGDWFIVKVDGLTGSHSNPYAKGDVRRLSHFVNGIDSDGNIEDKHAVAKRLKRLLSLNAIRLATKEEIAEAASNNGRILNELVPDSSDLALERNRRIQAEKELEVLRSRLGIAEGVRDNMTIQNGDKQEIAGSGDRTIEKDDWDLEEDNK